MDVIQDNDEWDLAPAPEYQEDIPFDEVLPEFIIRYSHRNNPLLFLKEQNGDIRVFSRKNIYPKRTFNQEYPITWNFRCISGTCSATLKADVSADHEIGPMVLRKPHSCDCTNQNLRYEIELFSSGLVEKGINGSTLAEAYNLQIEEVRNANNIAIGMIPQRIYFASMFQRQVTNQYPPVVLANLVGMEIPEEYRMRNGHPFLMAREAVANHPERVMFVLGQSNNVALFDHFFSSPRIHVDGTFKKAPYPFQQIFTLHTMHGRRALPIFYVLLTSKHCSMYTLFLNWLIGFAGERPINWSLPGDSNGIPRGVKMDFESGLIPALLACFLNIQLEGCMFHFTKACFAHLSTQGLKRAYSIPGTGIRMYVKKMWALAFLNPDNVRNVFNNLILMFRPELQQIQQFFEPVQAQNVINQIILYENYFRDTWVGADEVEEIEGIEGLEGYEGVEGVEGVVPRFPIKMWNVSHIDYARTNNDVEGWHTYLNNTIGLTTNLWKFI